MEKVKYFFASGYCPSIDDLFMDRNLCRLLSYYNDKSKLKLFIPAKREGKTKCEIFIDSGAFSAWSNFAKIDEEEYIKFINDNDDVVDLWGQLDVIPGVYRSPIQPSYQEVEEAAQATWDNYLRMRKRVPSPDKLLYTFHIGEPYSFLEHALQWKDEDGNKIPYIAFGGMVGKPASARINFLENVYELIRKYHPTVKVHTFGMTSLKILEMFPITSCDSTSWIQTGKNGGIYSDYGVLTFSDRQSDKFEHYSHLHPVALKRVRENLERFGYDEKELEVDYVKRCHYNVEYLEERYYTKGVYCKDTGVRQKRLF